MSFSDARYRGVRLLTAAVAGTWLFWIPAGLVSSTADWGLPVSRGLHYAGGLVPFALTLVFLRRFHGRDERRDFWRRTIDVRRIGWVWWGIVVLTVPVLTAAAGLAGVRLRGAQE